MAAEGPYWVPISLKKLGPYWVPIFKREGPYWVPIFKREGPYKFGEQCCQVQIIAINVQ